VRNPVASAWRFDSSLTDHALVMQGTGRAIPGSRGACSNRAEGAMARVSPVREMACKAIVGRFDSGPRPVSACAPDGQGSCVLHGRSVVRGRQAGQVFTLWQGSGRIDGRSRGPHVRFPAVPFLLTGWPGARPGGSPDRLRAVIKPLRGRTHVDLF